MIKDPYLWPALVLLTARIVERKFRLCFATLRVLAAFVFAGICFITWNNHAGRVNDASIFTRRYHASGLLGWSEFAGSQVLLDRDFSAAEMVAVPFGGTRLSSGAGKKDCIPGSSLYHAQLAGVYLKGSAEY